jgi:hypothetical protein
MIAGAALLTGTRNGMDEPPISGAIAQLCDGKLPNHDSVQCDSLAPVDLSGVYQVQQHFPLESFVSFETLSTGIFRNVICRSVCSHEDRGTEGHGPRNPR